MAAERVTAEEDHVEQQDERADPKAEMPASLILESARLHEVNEQQQDEDQREIQSIPVQVLHDERQTILAPVTLARLPNRTGKWVRPECFVVGAAVIVAGEAKEPRERQDQECH